MASKRFYTPETSEDPLQIDDEIGLRFLLFKLVDVERITATCIRTVAMRYVFVCAEFDFRGFEMSITVNQGAKFSAVEMLNQCEWLLKKHITESPFGKFIENDLAL